MSSYSHRSCTVPLLLVFLMVTMSWSSVLDNRHNTHTETSLSDVVVSHAGWGSPTSIDSTDSVGHDSSLAIDSSDHLHVTYRDVTNNNLEYMTHDGSSWSTPLSLDSTDDVGMESSLAIDSDDNLHVTYFDNTNANLEYMTYDGSSWSTPVTLDSTDDVGHMSSLAIDSNDNLHVTYHDNTNGNLEYMTYDGSSWSTPLSLDITDNVGYQSSLAIDSNDNLHVTYRDVTNNNLEYMTHDGSSWSTPVSLDSTGNVGYDSSLAIDSNDNLHAVYLDATNGNLEYITHDGSSWSTPISLDSIDDVGYTSSLAIDSNDNLHVTYYDATNANLEYITHDGSSWSTPASLDSTDAVGWQSSLAIDSSGNLHATYLDITNTNLEYVAHSTPTSPVISYSVDEFVLTKNITMSPTAIPSVASGVISISTIDSTPVRGRYSSTAIDSNGNSHTSYFSETGNRNLMYVTDASGSLVTTTLDSNSNTGISTSLSIDSNDAIHISYYDDSNRDLKYATDESGSWVISTLDSIGDVGRDSSVAVDSSDGVHISYRDTTNADLKYATDKSGSWVIATLDSDGNVGEKTSIALDSNDDVHIGYQNVTASNVKYATDKSGSWVYSTAYSSGSVGFGISLAVDFNNHIHIAFTDYTGDDLRYVTDESGSWVASRLDWFADVGKNPSLAVDSKNNIHISYQNYSFGHVGELKYATNKCGTWVYMEVEQVGNSSELESSLAIDANDTVHISYYHPTTQSLKYVTLDEMVQYFCYSISPTLPHGLNINRTSGEISGTPLAVSPRTMYSVIGTNSAGTSTAQINITVIDSSPNISYVSDDLLLTNNTPMVTASPTNQGSPIQAYTVESIFSNTSLASIGTWGGGSSLAFDSNDVLHISFWEGTNQDLMYATDKTGSWVFTTLDSSGMAGEYSSMSIDSNDAIHIAYWHYSDGELKYATDKSGSWVTTTLDSSGVGQYPSLSLDSNDAVHISYYDFSNQDLKYVTDKSGSWVVSTLDSLGNLGYFTSIDIDSNNAAHISYYDDTNQDLKYATDKSGSWVYSAIDTQGNVGEHTSLSVDSNDHIHVAYLESSSLDLKYATDKSGSWVNTTLDSLHEVGFFTSLVHDSNNGIHLLYFDTSSDDLKYATDTSGSWALSTLDSSGDVGEYSSLAIDSNDGVHFTYRDKTNSDIKYGNLISTVTEGFTLTPSLPTGLEFNNSNGNISGTPTELFNRTMFTITGMNSNGSSVTFVNITVETEPPTFSYSPENITLTKNSIMQILSPTTSSVGITSWGILPEPPDGLLFNTVTGEISGTPVALQPLTMYTITAANSDGSSTATVNITVNDEIAIPSYTPTELVLIRDVEMTSFNPEVLGGAVLGWQISPELPTGLQFGTNNGSVWGSSSVNMTQTQYTVWANNSGGSPTTTFLLTVNEPLAVLSYNPENLTLIRSTNVTNLAPTLSGGLVETWEVSPALPLGLSLEDGFIKGFVVVNSSLQTYTIWANNSGGSVSSTINITVNEQTSPLSYNPSQFILTRGIQMSNITPIRGEGEVSTWDISPQLPAGLQFSNGVVSGTPDVNMTQTNYTVWANHSGESSSAVLRLTIHEPAPVLSYSPEDISLIRGEMMVEIHPILGEGLIENWSLNQSLPEGLLFANGSISGTPLFNSSTASYTVRVNNSGGMTLFVFNLTVVEPAPILSMDTANYSLVYKNLVNPFQVNNSGGMIESWTVRPSLPPGMIMLDGEISGQPTIRIGNTSFTIEAINSGGSDSITFTLSVYQPPVAEAPLDAEPTNYLFWGLSLVFVLIVILSYILKKPEEEDPKEEPTEEEEAEEAEEAEEEERQIEEAFDDENLEEGSSESVSESAPSQDAAAPKELITLATTTVEGSADETQVVEDSESDNMSKNLPSLGASEPPGLNKDVPSLEGSELIEGKNLVQLPATNVWSQGKNLVELPTPSEVDTGKNLVELPSSDIWSKGKDLVDLPPPADSSKEE